MNSSPTLESSRTLESRITAMLNNPNSESEALYEIINATELAIATAQQTIDSERASAADLICTPSAEAAQHAISRAEAAQMNRDRLNSALPNLRKKLSAALREEAKEKWLADYRRVHQRRDEAVALFRDYQKHAEAIAQMFALAEVVDKEVSRINSNAPDGELRRLHSVELEARNITEFSRDNPSLSETVQLRDWNSSGKSLWPCTSSGSFAAEFASGMAAPIYDPADWSKPELQLRRRAEVERQHHEIGEFYQRETEQQEQRLNAEERERMTGKA
jgi:hypothetical protein